jgi:hypothetical protein
MEAGGGIVGNGEFCNSDEELGTVPLGFDVVDAWVDEFDKLGIAASEAVGAENEER